MAEVKVTCETTPIKGENNDLLISIGMMKWQS